MGWDGSYTHDMDNVDIVSYSDTAYTPLPNMVTQLPPLIITCCSMLVTKYILNSTVLHLWWAIIRTHVTYGTTNVLSAQVE